MVRMRSNFLCLLCAAGAAFAAASGSTPALSFGPSTFTAPSTFPTSLFRAYFNNPTATSVQPQPVISDPVTHEKYPFALTDPDHIPQIDTKDPHPLPRKASDAQLLRATLAQIDALARSLADDACGACTAALGTAQLLALAAPAQGPALVVALCERFHENSNCTANFGPSAVGAAVTQVLARMNTSGADGHAFCQNFLGGQCPALPTAPLNLTTWFAKPKPDPLPAPRTPSGKRLKVLHLSDVHVDPRFATGAEANCTSGLCCRANAFNAQSPHTPLVPAPRFGAYSCDAPLALVAAAVQAIPVLAGTERTGFAWTVYTGDLVSHDAENQLSRDYVLYTETLLYGLFRQTLGAGPVYAVLGNHDSYNQAQDAPHALGGALAGQFSWNYEHVASLWEHEGWIPQSAGALARAHYAAYMVRRTDGLRIITLNTDLWYRANYFNYINVTAMDPSGMLRFLTDELQDAEDKGDRVWIMGHVLSGWDGTNGMKNPTDLFYQIVDRFSPHVIANIFWGHTHEDQLSIFYANNATDISADTAQTVAWIGPSLTPLTNLNAGFRVYEVDSHTFDIVDAHTWRSDVNAFPELGADGPAFVYEYSTRAAYGANITWGATDPLNATWWHRVTEQMEANADLVTTFNTFQGKDSARTPPCTGACAAAKICYIRSGSSSLAQQNCPAGFGSVQ